MLDGLATRLAAPHLTQDDHERLRTIVDAMGAAVKGKDLDRVLRVNRDFHQIVWRASRATRLYALLENLYDASQRYRQISVLLPGRLNQITQEHRRISRALASGDATKAERFAIAHLEGTALRLIRSVKWRKRAAGSGHGPARRGRRWIPEPLNWRSYVLAWKAQDFTRYFANSGVVAVAITLGNLLLASLAGYSLAKFRYLGRGVLFILILSTMMLPLEVTMVPLFLIN